MQAVKLRTHCAGDLQGVGGGRRIDPQIGRRFTVQLGAGAVAAGAQLNGRHVGEAHQLPLRAAAEDNLAKAGRLVQTPQPVDGQRLLLAVKYRRGAHLPRRALHILLAQRLGDIIRGDVERVHAVRAQPDTHAVIPGAKHLHLADAGQAGQRLAHLGAGVVADKQRRQRAQRRVEAYPHKQIAGALAHLDAILLHLRRELRQRLRHPVLHVDRRQVGIGARREGYAQAVRPLIRAGGLHIQHMIDAVELGLQRGGDGFCHV